MAEKRYAKSFCSRIDLLCKIAFLLLFCLAVHSLSAELPASLARLAASDTVCNVWVFFKDKPDVGNTPLSKRALERRRDNSYIENVTDTPLNEVYIEQIVRSGATLRHRFPWGNAASFSVHAGSLELLASMPFVAEIRPVGVYTRRGDDSGIPKRSWDGSDYGDQYHLEMQRIKQAHHYIESKKGEPPGKGVIVAFFDSGFRLDHRCYDHLRQRDGVIATYDFVENKIDVHDHDSIMNDPGHPYHESDVHGTQTLSLVAGYEPGRFMGTAWGAQFLLARTEDYYLEVRTEEDNWAAAVVWAESLGVDIISSSLGYRDFFDDPDSNYTYEQMDGVSTVVSIAAHEAVRRGVLIVNSAGNEEGYEPGTIIAPADVDGVVAVGAVNSNGVRAFWSSIGPTYDGRIKPDVVAPGVSILVPAAYSEDRYTLNSGTSFSAPIVTGIAALIMQSTNQKTSDFVRERLYSSCFFVTGQDSIDNYHGYGMPDALYAVMGRDEIETPYLKVYPTLVPRGGKLQGEFSVGTADHPFSSANISIRSLDGKLVWTRAFHPDPSVVMDFEWDCTVGGRRVAPGLYFLFATYRGVVFREKFVVGE